MAEGPEDIRAIDAGYHHSLALGDDGSIWGWGNNHRGQLGDGTTEHRHTPFRLTGITDAAAIAAGNRHTLAAGLRAFPFADFTAEPRSGFESLTVDFTDRSTANPTSWIWEYTTDSLWRPFSTEKDPTFTFSLAGNYSIKLTAKNPAGKDTYIKTDYITVKPLIQPTIERIEFLPLIPLAGENFTTNFSATINEGTGYVVTGLEWYFFNDTTPLSLLDERLPPIGGERELNLTPSKSWDYGDYGEKRVRLVLYGHKSRDSEPYQVDHRDLEFKVFFPMGGPADWKTNTSAAPLTTWARDPIITRDEPNWYHYWKRDGAVEKIEKTIYDPDTDAAGYFHPTTDTLALGRAAPVLWRTVYLDTGLARVPNSSTFIIDGKEVVGGTFGIKGATATVFHEIHHQTIASEPLFENLTDSDYNITELRYRYQVIRDGRWFFTRSNDGLPDVFENGTLGTTWEPLGSLTSVNHTDTYNFRSHFHRSYITYGDQEYLCYREENRALGRVEGFEPRYDYTRDWSDGGRMAAEQAGKEMAEHPGILSYQDWRRDHILATPSDHPDLLTSNDAAYGFISYHDYGEDTSGNGLFNTLNIDVTFSVQYPGLHGITGQLTDPDGTVIARADHRSDLPVAGTYEGTLSFDGSAIHLSGVPGPYTLNLKLSESGGREAFTLIEEEDAYTTAAYSLSGFEGAQVSLTGIYDDEARDTDGDGIPDILHVDLGLDVRDPGTYHIAAGLYKDGEYLTRAFTLVDAGAGSQTASLLFGGIVLGINGIDGPYELRNVVVISQDGIMMDYAAFPHTTRAYTAADFLPPPPDAGFIATPGEGDAPLTVQFTDESSGGPVAFSWEYSSGDGWTAFSTAKNPSYTFDEAGSYAIRLTARNDGGESTVTEPGSILVTEPPVPDAAFAAAPRAGPAPHTVRFTDQSSGDPITWQWSFGDGGTSTARHPEHTYTTPGTYTVSLTVSTVGGSSTETRPDLITVHIRGDFNGNGRVDIGDVAKVAWMAAGLIEPDPAADFDGDGEVDAADAARIAYYYVGKIPAL